MCWPSFPLHGGPHAPRAQASSLLTPTQVSPCRSLLAITLVSALLSVHRRCFLLTHSERSHSFFLQTPRNQGVNPKLHSGASISATPTRCVSSLAVEGIVERVHCIAAVNWACLPCDSTTLDRRHKQPTLPHTRYLHLKSFTRTQPATRPFTATTRTVPLSEAHPSTGLILLRCGPRSDLTATALHSLSLTQAHRAYASLV